MRDDLCPECGLMPSDASWGGCCSRQCEAELEEREGESLLARIRETSAECAL